MRVMKFHMARLGGSLERAAFQLTPPLGSSMLRADTPSGAQGILFARRAASLGRMAVARTQADVATVGCEEGMLTGRREGVGGGGGGRSVGGESVCGRGVRLAGGEDDGVAQLRIRETFSRPLPTPRLACAAKPRLLLATDFPAPI